MSYYIINLPATRQAQQLTFLARDYPWDTTALQQALVVSEDRLNASLERFDNGRTTRAVLTNIVESHTGDWRELVGWTIAESKGAAA